MSDRMMYSLAATSMVIVVAALFIVWRMM